MLIRRGPTPFAIVACIVLVVLALTTTQHWLVFIALWLGLGNQGRNKARKLKNVAPFVQPIPSVPQPQSPPTASGAVPSSAAIAAGLNALVVRVSEHASKDILALVQSIVSSINAILPMLDSDKHEVGGHDAYTIRQTALHYLPETVAAYFRLPPDYRASQPIENGKTARDLLVEQLTLLDERMKDIVRNLVSNDARALVANGQFLRERFSPDYFKSV